MSAFIWFSGKIQICVLKYKFVFGLHKTKYKFLFWNTNFYFVLWSPNTNLYFKIQICILPENQMNTLIGSKYPWIKNKRPKSTSSLTKNCTKIMPAEHNTTSPYLMTSSRLATRFLTFLSMTETSSGSLTSMTKLLLSWPPAIDTDPDPEEVNDMFDDEDDDEEEPATLPPPRMEPTVVDVLRALSSTFFRVRVIRPTPPPPAPPPGSPQTAPPWRIKFEIKSCFCIYHSSPTLPLKLTIESSK